MKISELAKKYSVTSDELILLLAKAGYEIKDGQSSVDFDMLNALERHFNWSAPAKKKTKAKPKAKAKKTATTTPKAKVKVKAKAKAKLKAKLIPREKPEKKVKEEAPAAVAEEKVKAEVKTKAKTVSKSKVKEKPAAEADSKAKAETKAKAKPKTQAKAKATAKAEAKPKTKAEKEPKATAEVKPKTKKTKTKVKAEPKAAEEKKKPAESKVKTPKASTKSAVLVEEAPHKPAAPPTPPPKKAPPVVEKPEKPRRPGKPPRGKKMPVEQEAQRKAVRESVRRTLAKLETTRKTKRRKTKAEEAEPAELEPIQVQDKSSVASLAYSLGLPAGDILVCCEELGATVTEDQELDRELIELVAEALGRPVEIEAVYGEARLREEAQIDPAKLKPRAPVVTVMGHVDHGKTSILDFIRKTKVVAGEAGGITQHIGAYEVATAGGNISFIDTPGHEAFTAMRARGAQLTDIVVLVVAADDGVMPQTVEAINHTKAAGVPMVVAINKIDLPGADSANVKQQLVQFDVVVEDFGGDVVSVDVSAKTGQGIDKLLEMISLQAEVLELNADPTSNAQGVVVEAKKEEGRGILVTVLVQQGTLRVGDVVVMGNECGKVRSLVDYRGKRVKKAAPATPAQILGCNGLPVAGDNFVAVKSEREAREISAKRQEALRSRDLQTTKPLTLEDLYAQIQRGEVKELEVVIKADTNGSVEALKDSLIPLSLEEVSVKILHYGVGVVTETDVLLAVNSNALVVAFNTNVTPKAKEIAKQKGIEIRRYTVIYEIIEDIEDALKGMLEPEYVERVLGRAEVRQIFRVSKLGLIAGSMVIEGTIPRNASARVHRNGELMFEGKITSLKRFQNDVKEVAENFECGIGLSGCDDIQEQDVIEAFVVEEKARVV